LKKLEEIKPTEDIRIMEIAYCRILKIVDPFDSVSEVSEYTTLAAEVTRRKHKKKKERNELMETHNTTQKVSADEVQIPPTSVRVKVAHITKEFYTRNFSNPFIIVVKKGETFGQVKERIRTKLGVSEEEFAKWKVAVVNNFKQSFSYPKDGNLLFLLLSSFLLLRDVALQLRWWIQWS
jgi:ubiquitin carboxyl-terminal hydrolase 7